MTLKLRLRALRRRSGIGRKLDRKPEAVFVDLPVVPVIPAKETNIAFRVASPDVLPTLEYTDEDDTTSPPSLTSSSSYASSLTYAEPNVDDGLDAWGLPKVMGAVLEDEFFDCEDDSLAAIRPATATQRAAQQVLVLVYFALLVRSRKTLPRYARAQEPRQPIWKVFM